MEYFDDLLVLLEAERKADESAFRELSARAGIAERRNNGLSWYPVVIRETETGAGDYLTVELERSSFKEVPHFLRQGATASLFSGHNSAEDRITGTLSWVGTDRLRLHLRLDELPDWTRDGKLGIDLLFDDASYDEMKAALQEAARRQGAAGTLIPVLTGQRNAEFEPVATPELPGLNQRQRQAVARILAARELAIVHGPPGTGKTTTLVAAIGALLRRDPAKILVVAPSNTAVDLLSEKLSEAGISVLRVGNPARVSDRLQSLTPEARLAGHSQMKDVKRMRKQAAAFRDMAYKYKRQFGKAEREQRKALLDEARKVMKDVLRTEQYMMADLLSKAQVIAATPVGAAQQQLKGLNYQAVVIDEAGQALEPACWIAMLKADKVILAGDHQQLPPTLKAGQTGIGSLADTLLERCVRRHPEAVVMLEEQYRMHAQIMGYSSAVFYADHLQAHSSVAEHLLYPGAAPLLYVDTAGCGFEEQEEDGGISNPEEAAFLLRFLENSIEELAAVSGGGAFPSVAVIAPYRKQVSCLQELVAGSSVLAPYTASISVNTVDSFQGQERDMVLISMTRSNTGGTVGFLSDTRRMNVAMTRARKQLVVIGDSATLAQHPFYAGFQDYAMGVDAYTSAWAYMD